MRGVFFIIRFLSIMPVIKKKKRKKEEEVGSTLNIIKTETAYPSHWKPGLTTLRLQQQKNKQKKLATGLTSLV